MTPHLAIPSLLGKGSATYILLEGILLKLINICVAPHAQLESLFDILEQMLSNSINNTHFLIAGDFNIDML